MQRCCARFVLFWRGWIDRRWSGERGRDQSHPGLLRERRIDTQLEAGAGAETTKEFLFDK